MKSRLLLAVFASACTLGDQGQVPAGPSGEGALEYCLLTDKELGRAFSDVIDYRAVPGGGTGHFAWSKADNALYFAGPWFRFPEQRDLLVLREDGRAEATPLDLDAHDLEIANPVDLFYRSSAGTSYLSWFDAGGARQLVSLDGLTRMSVPPDARFIYDVAGDFYAVSRDEGGSTQVDIFSSTASDRVHSFSVPEEFGYMISAEAGAGQLALVWQKPNPAGYMDSLRVQVFDVADWTETVVEIPHDDIAGLGDRVRLLGLALDDQAVALVSNKGALFPKSTLSWLFLDGRPPASTQVRGGGIGNAYIMKMQSGACPGNHIADAAFRSTAITARPGSEP